MLVPGWFFGGLGGRHNEVCVLEGIVVGLLFCKSGKGWEEIRK
jgi:hypothetical protein